MALLTRLRQVPECLMLSAKLCMAFFRPCVDDVSSAFGTMSLVSGLFCRIGFMGWHSCGEHPLACSRSWVRCKFRMSVMNKLAWACFRVPSENQLKQATNPVDRRKGQRMISQVLKKKVVVSFAHIPRLTLILSSWRSRQGDLRVEKFDAYVF